MMADCSKLLIWHTKTFSKLQTRALPFVTNAGTSGGGRGKVTNYLGTPNRDTIEKSKLPS